MYAMDTNGENKKFLFETGEVFGRFKNIVVDENGFYFKANDFMIDGSSYKIMNYNLFTNELKEVYISESNFEIISAFEDKIVILDGNMEAMVSFADKSVPFNISTVDITTKDEAEIISYTASSNNQKNAFFVSNEYLIEFEKIAEGQAKIIRTNLLTGDTEIINENVAFFGIVSQNNQVYKIGDKIAINMYEGLAINPETYRDETYVLDVKTGDFQRAKLEFSGIILNENISASKVIMPEYKEDYIYSHDPLAVVGEAGDYYIIITAVTDKPFVEIGDKAFEFPLSYSDAVLELITKENYENNINDYIRLR